MNPDYVMRDYDNALKQIYDTGFEILGDRTGVGTRCLLGLTTRYDISTRVPVLTKRKVSWKSIVKEVLWYISGSDNIYDLQAMGCHIWDPWLSDDFTTSRGLPEGSIGYGYGPNLIHYGGDIHVDASRRALLKKWSHAEGSLTKVAANKLYPPTGFNQLDYVINTLKASPASRQALFTLWRPDKLDQVRLPACHHTYQFIVSPDVTGKLTNLTCFVFQRSNDYPIGVGMGNIWCATLFTYMIAQQCGLNPKEVVHVGSHCHIYLNALPAVETYLGRGDEPNSPILTLNKRESIYDYVPEDFELADYNPLPAIQFPLAV